MKPSETWGGSKHGLALGLLRICTLALMDYQDREVSLQKSASPLSRSSQALSGWMDTFRCLQRCLGSGWSSFTVSQLCDGGQVMGGHTFYWGETQAGGVLHWWWTFWNVLPSAHRISASVSSGSLVKLVPDSQLEGLIQTDETLSVTSSQLNLRQEASAHLSDRTEMKRRGIQVPGCLKSKRTHSDPFASKQKFLIPKQGT